MSGYPNLSAISELRAALRDLSSADALIARADADRRRALVMLGEGSQQQRDALDKVNKLLAEMDCAQPGNGGYHNRLLVLLTALADDSDRPRESRA